MRHLYSLSGASRDEPYAGASILTFQLTNIFGFRLTYGEGASNLP